MTSQSQYVVQGTGYLGPGWCLTYDWHNSIIGNNKENFDGVFHNFSLTDLIQQIHPIPGPFLDGK